MILLTTLVLTLVAPSQRPNEDKDFHSAALIQEHLLSVARSLRDTDVSMLSPALRARRAFLLERLEAYAQRGVFPHNHVLPFQNPVFLDEHDTACAVGQLMIDSGHRALAERIRATNNTGYLLELDVDGLADWVATSGFTPIELATIQPSYGPARSDDTFIIQTSLQAESPQPIRVVRRAWWGASGGEVASVAQVGGKVFFVDGHQFPEVGVRRVDDMGIAIEREGQARAVQVADGKLFALYNDGVFMRAETGAWSRRFELDPNSDSRWFQVRSTTDIWVSQQGGSATLVSHFEGGALKLVAQLPLGVTDFFASSDGRLFWRSSDSQLVMSSGLLVGAPTNQLSLEGTSSVFGSGDKVFAIRGTTIVSIDRNGEVSQLGELPSKAAPSAPYRGVALRDGRLAVVGPNGLVMVRDAAGAWEQPSLGETSARFANITEGETGVLITVDRASCVKEDWLCDAPPLSQGCSAIGGASLAGLLLSLTARRRARR